MQLFYDPDLTTGHHQLRPEEATHAARVLRKKTGDRLDLIDGKGGWFRAEITSLNKRKCWLEVTELRRQTARANHHLTVLVAPTKNIDRFEWVLEKATEIGVDRIVPILTAHSERKRIRTDRLVRVLEAAMKQSLRAWLPRLTELTPLAEALSEARPADQKFLAYLGADQTPLLTKKYRPGGDVTLAIGPEGGFSPEEAALAHAAGFQNISLGPHRLRTETAALTAVHTIESTNWHAP